MLLALDSLVVVGGIKTNSVVGFTENLPNPINDLTTFKLETTI